MKLMSLDHISVLPFLTCNFKCPYCIAYLPRWYRDKKPFGLWEERYDDVVKFIGGLDKRMILASGGEPLLWDRWEDLIKRTDHYWYFVTNTSRIPKWLKDKEIKEKVKLFLSAYHRNGIPLNKYINNVKQIQDMGYAIFTKVMYTRNPEQKKEAEQIIKAGIPMSFVPLVNVDYHPDEIKSLKPYCMSGMYYLRFFRVIHDPALCAAGTDQSFQVDGLTMTRCGHYSCISLNSVPRGLRKLFRGYVGDIYRPEFYDKPRMCNKIECFCENHHFSGLLDASENPKWQKFIDARVWE